MNQEKLQVAIIDSERGSYLLSPDIERGILEPYADVTLHRVKMQEAARAGRTAQFRQSSFDGPRSLLRRRSTDRIAS